MDVVEAEGKALVLDLPSDLPPVLADRDLVRRVIDNLLSNALKYTTMRIEVSIEWHASESYLQVSVSDDGPGIPPQLRDVIFDRFVQAEAADARKGAGLGLTFCRLAVEAHGGRIWVEGSEEGGCRFVFTLPVQVEEK